MLYKPYECRTNKIWNLIQSNEDLIQKMATSKEVRDEDYWLCKLVRALFPYINDFFPFFDDYFPMFIRDCVVPVLRKKFPELVASERPGREKKSLVTEFLICNGSEWRDVNWNIEFQKELGAG